MNVLPQDEKLAEKLLECSYLYLNWARVELLLLHFDEAERWATEFLRYKRDLDELVRRKEEHDRLMEVVEMMKERGIDIAIITRGNK